MVRLVCGLVSSERVRMKGRDGAALDSSSDDSTRIVQHSFVLLDAKSDL